MWTNTLLNIKYVSDFIKNPDFYFEHLLSLDWLNATETRQEYLMADKQTAYTYGSGNGVRTYTSNPFTENILEIRDILGESYNVCFLNRYDNQRHHLGWHADNHQDMDKTHPIAVVSFGAEREIW